jgi:class 3 adenylate cyclase/tetratricopeptide (TPR) repeat protein
MTLCASCGFRNSPEARFCGGCGQPLQDRTSRERRHLTVMFCDLVGSSALAERLDPEELADLVLAYQRAATGAIEAFDGHVAQHLGDGLLVYFGYPAAHEDDARRAVHAGLRILEALAALNAGLDPARRLSVRIGIHTGAVVTGDVGSGTTQERLAIGSTPNVAARLQSIAGPDTVVVSGETHALLQHAFVCEPLDVGPLKGLSQAVTVYRVVRRADAPAVPAGSAEMIGRGDELERLTQAHAAAAAGELAAVLVTAEAGLGKSRLVEAFADRIGRLPGDLWVAQCSPYEQSSALSPIAGVFQRLFYLADAHTPALKLERLAAGVEQIGLRSADTVPLLASLLGVPLQAPFTPLDISPQKRRELTVDAMIAIVMRTAETRPLTWVIEDLHWADPSTLQFISVLLSRAASSRLLLLLTARPSFVHSWSGMPSIQLVPLDRMAAAAIVHRVAGGRTLSAAVVDQIVDKTDGVPLFIEELTKTVLESSVLTELGADGPAGRVASVSIPTSLQASLTARLDRLGSAKEVAQLGSVIGREFTFQMLQAVAPWGDDVLTGGLRRLTDAELVYEHGTFPLARYSFRHALIRDAAYEMLLKSLRREYHGRIGKAMLDRFPELVETRPELAAHHFTEAGAFDAALPHWIKAGQKAAGESANAEAIAHLQRALTLINAMPPSPERDGAELGVQLMLAPSLELAKGYVVDEVERAYLRAEELNQRVSDPRQRFWIQLGICQFRTIRGEIAEGQRGAQRLLELAESLAEPFFAARACCVFGITLCYGGSFASASEWLERALDSLPGPDVEFLAVAAMDLGALIHMYTAWAQWHLGFSDRAKREMQIALTSAEATGRTHARGHALIFAGAHVSHFLGDVDAVRRYSRAAAELSQQYGFPVWGIEAGLWSAWADSIDGDADARAAAASASLSALRAFQETGAGLALGYFIALAADTHLQCGDLEAAESLIDEALRLGAERPDPIWESEVRRLKGEVVLRRALAGGNAQDRVRAAEYFTQAQDIARRQGARPLEERAASSLARVTAASGGSMPAQA